MRKRLCITIPLLAALFATAHVIAENQNSGQNHSSDTSTKGTTASQSSASAQSHQTSGKKISFNQLPQAVQKTMRAEAGNLNLENTRELTINGQTCYQATFDKGTLKGQIAVGEDGSLLQYSESADIGFFAAVPKLDTSSKMALQDLPEPVRQAVTARASTNQVAEISKSTAAGTPQYHVAFNEAGTHTDMWLDPQGKVIARVDKTALFAAPLVGSQNTALQSAPELVQQALREHGASASNITDLDKGTWNGQTAYRAMVNKNGSVRPLLVTESGKLLSSQPSDNSSATGSPASSESNRSSQHDSDSQKSSQTKQSSEHSSQK